MKKNRLVSIALSVALVFWFSGVVVAGGGIEPPGGGLPPGQNVDDCVCIQQIVLPPAGSIEDLVIPKLKGPYLKGTFTVSFLPGSDTGDEAWVTHVFLRWGNRIFVQPFFTVTGGNALCTVSDEQLKNLLLQSQILCFAQVESYFGLEGTPFVKELVITDRAGCSSEYFLYDDIIRGEITVSIAPFTCPETP